MRILMLTQFFPPTVGGEERHVEGLSRELAARGHDVSVATLGANDQHTDQSGGWDHPNSAAQREPVQVYRIRTTMQRVPGAYAESGRPHVPPLPDPEAVAALRRIIARERPEVVHAHNWLVHSFLPLKRWSGARLVVTLHDYSLVCAKKRLMYREAPCSGPGLKKCLECAGDHYGPLKGVPTVVGTWAMGIAERRAVDMFIAVSQATAAGNRVFDPARPTGTAAPCRVIPNFVPDDLGIRPAVWAPSDPRLAELPDEDYLLFVGDISHDKGAGTLLRAYRQLSDPPPLVLIGRLSPDLRVDLPDNVLHLGPWPNELVMEARNRSLLALAPSLWAEPFGIVVLEAMASGRPVIASNIGGLPDMIVDGQTGLLVPPGDSTALRDAMQRMLTDPAWRARLGRAARDRVDLFRAGAVVPRIEAVYRAVTGRPDALWPDALDAPAATAPQYEHAVTSSPEGDRPSLGTILR